MADSICANSQDPCLTLKYELFLVYKFGCVKRCDSKQRQEEKGWILMHNNLFRTQEQCGVEGVRES